MGEPRRGCSLRGRLPPWPLTLCAHPNRNGGSRAPAPLRMPRRGGGEEGERACAQRPGGASGGNGWLWVPRTRESFHPEDARRCLRGRERLFAGAGSWRGVLGPQTQREAPGAQAGPPLPWAPLRISAPPSPADKPTPKCRGKRKDPGQPDDLEGKDTAQASHTGRVGEGSGGRTSRHADRRAGGRAERVREEAALMVSWFGRGAKATHGEESSFPPAERTVRRLRAREGEAPAPP